MSLLEIKHLRVHYVTDQETVYAVNGIDLSLDSGAIGIDECVRILAEVSGMKKK